MSERHPILSLRGFSLAEEGPRLDLDLVPGDRFAVMGPADGGQGELLETILNRDRPAQGAFELEARAVPAVWGSFGRKRTPQDWARSLADDGVFDALDALGLGDVCAEPMASLTPNQVAACGLLPCLLTPGGLFLVDGQLDALDPWCLDTAIAALLSHMDECGGALLAATVRPDTAERLGSLLVLREREPVFAGTVDDLLRHHGPVTIEVETEDESTVLAMAEPLAISIRAEAGRVLIQAEDGQETAAKLLTQGYGVVKSVLVREPSLTEALLSLR